MSTPTPPPTSGTANDPDIPTSGRSLSTVGFVIFVVVYLLVVQGVPYISTAGLDDVEYGVFPDNETVWWALVVPVALSLVFAAGVATWLRWWPQMLRDHRPVNRWVLIVPALMVVAIIAGTDYASVGDASLGFVLLFLFGTMLVGMAEETVFRGVGVTTFRANGFAEPRVALWTSIIFGLAHGTNIFTSGAVALPQIVASMLAGFYFYLVLRVTGTLIACMVLHWLWDAGLFTGAITDEQYAGGLIFLGTNLIIGIVLLVRRHKIGIDPAAVTEPSHA